MIRASHRLLTRLLLPAAIVIASGPTLAGTVVPCDGNCTWSVTADDVEVGRGSYAVDPETGGISLRKSWSKDLGDGSFVAVDNMNGNADPILGFSVSAGTGAAGKTFVFNFSLPVQLAGPIAASSSVSYSLTSLTAAGAQIDPLFGKVVTAQEVDTSIGGLSPLSKGVDVGNRFFFVGGPQTQNSPVYTAASIFSGDLAYDLMSVTVAFSLSPNANVGASGFVQQIPSPVPLPAGVWLLGSGMLAFVGYRRRKVERS